MTIDVRDKKEQRPPESGFQKALCMVEPNGIEPSTS